MATQLIKTKEEIDMPFVAINATNAYDPNNNTRYATQAEADTRAREVLTQFPTAKVFVAQVLKEYSATVTVTVTDPESTEPAE